MKQSKVLSSPLFVIPLSDLHKWLGPQIKHLFVFMQNVYVPADNPERLSKWLTKSCLDKNDIKGKSL